MNFIIRFLYNFFKGESDEQQQIKDCLFEFWTYCNDNGYKMQGYKEGALMPDVITCKIE
jgi:hypothetical protein